MCLDGCCTYQTKLYVEYGQKNGLSPEEYLDKIFKFQRVGDKKVVFLKVRFHRPTCMNVISQIGFGNGDLKIIGSRNGIKGKFAFPALGNSTAVPVFYGETIEAKLTFSWFIINILCLEKPELCEPIVEKRATSSGN
ncbi:uncharacterized protein LOC142338201 [Convolutriloba macropyga]|uniref:uncharacterized protein LOC142338201 n=1 Tax=Convolutriloba macropyga TaxID=536237 RepID=UPI003F526CFC